MRRSSHGQVGNPLGGWVVEYGTLSIDCRDEEDAKGIVRSLRQRGRVIARTAYGVSPGRRLEGEDLTKWLLGPES